LRVYVEDVFADTTRLNMRNTLTMPPRTRSIQLSYTALAFSGAKNTRFFYLLDGFNKDWVEAEGKREAIYTNLPPGNYRFLVKALDKLGNESAARPLSFVIAAAFYQTWWFYGLCVSGVLGLVTALWRARVSRLRREFAIVLSERVRVSREIHDTVLQSLIGVSLRLEVLTDHVNEPAQCRSALVKTREQVENYIRETRQWIWNLRSPKLDAGDFGSVLKHVAAEAVSETRITVTVDIKGDARHIAPEVEQELLRIAEEAIANAVRHSDCKSIRVSLDYGRRQIELEVIDDGIGFDIARLGVAADARYGLTTMRERAAQLGGTVVVESSPGGTRVQAVVPDAPVRKIRRWFAASREAA
jgi:signal transduction histidine kinase